MFNQVKDIGSDKIDCLLDIWRSLLEEKKRIRNKCKDKNRDNVIKNYPIISMDDFIEEVEDWTNDLDTGTEIKVIKNRFKNQKNFLNNILLIIWYKGKHKDYNKYKICLKKGISYIRFDYNSQGEKEAEEIYEKLKNKALKKAKTPYPMIQNKTIDPQKYPQAEQIIRDKFSLSQIIALLHKKPNQFPPELTNTGLDSSHLKLAFEKASSVYALFSSGPRQNKKGHSHPIEVKIIHKKEYNTDSVKIIGNRIEKIEDKLHLSDRHTVTTYTTSRITAAIEKAVVSTLSYIQNLQKEFGFPIDESLNLNTYSIVCNIGDNKIAVHDGETIGLAVAISALSDYLDLPTKQLTALTGVVDGSRIGKIGEVADVFPKIKAAINAGVSSVIIPETNYSKLKKEKSSQLESLMKKIIVLPVRYLYEAIEASFERDKIKKCLKVSKKTVHSTIREDLNEFESFMQDRKETINNNQALKFYIPLNCSETIYSSESNKDLEGEIYKFINGNISTLLLLGDSGSGKSTVCARILLDPKLINQHQEDNSSPIPILIRLGISSKAVEDGTLIENEFKRLGFSEKTIAYLRRNKKFVFILDGYDELRVKKNIYLTNRLDDWNAKVIITCRTQYLEKTEEYLSLFSKIDPRSQIPDPKSYKTLYIVPFSDNKIDEYLNRYAPSEESTWKDWHQYKQKIINLYNLKELSTNPLLLSIITQTLPSLAHVEENKPISYFTRPEVGCQ